MIHLEKLTINQHQFPTHDSYPFHLQVFQQTRILEFSSPVTFFIGENGSGKSTLLKALSKKSDVYIWNNSAYSRFEHNPFEDALSGSLQLQWKSGKVPGSYFGAQIFQHFAQLVDDWAARDPNLLEYFGGASLMTQSHGQSLMSFFKARYRIKGIYFVDEPETALSPKSQIELIKILQSAGFQGPSQFIIATHSPILLACPGATIFSFDKFPIEKTEYEETEYYRVYKDFLNDRSEFINGL